MKITVLGLNHKSAPVSVRERLALEGEDMFKALEALKERFEGCEFAILSTCNRVEFYAANRQGDVVDVEQLKQFICEYRDFEIAKLDGLTYTKHDADAVTHLLTVASSLDSMVLGEPQIISQVKDCFTKACTVKSAGKILNRLFHVAFETSKAIYSDTSIASRRISVAGVAIDLAKQLFADITKAKAMVIGAGEMGELLVEHLLHVKCKDITILNRTYQRGVDLADKHGVGAGQWEEMDEYLCKADIVVASAGGQDYLFKKDDFKARLRKRRKGSLLVVDIAVPRNFDPAINELDGVYLYSVDDLAQVVEENVKMREGQIDVAVEIICDKAAEYMEWLNAMEIGPLVGQLKSGFDRIRKNEMERFFTGERADACCKETMEAMVSKVVNKLLHCVIANLNIEAKEHGPDHAVKMAGDIMEKAQQIIDDSSGK